MNPDLCTACEAYVEGCPSKTCTLRDGVLTFDLDRCFGCGRCAAGCPVEAIAREEKPGLPGPPKNRKKLREALEPESRVWSRRFRISGKMRNT